MAGAVHSIDFTSGFLASPVCRAVLGSRIFYLGRETMTETAKRNDGRARGPGLSVMRVALP
jgi:hypothetical protein